MPETTRERKVKGAEGPFWKIYAVNTGAASDESLRGGLPRERFAKPDDIVDPKNGRRPRLRGSR